MPRVPTTTLLGLALGLGASGCQELLPEVEEPAGSEDASSGSTGSGSTSSSGGGPTTDTGVASGSASGDDTTAGLDSSGTGSGDGTSTGDSGSESTGGLPSMGCADGNREALADEVAYPDIAACAGGFQVPGVRMQAPLCDRGAGNFGRWPDGMGCTIEDLCAEGWHVCATRGEVAEAGLSACDDEEWGEQFFVTGQSGEGSNTCNDTGTDDVFGCGGVGYSNIDQGSCAPLNRSTSNLCVKLAGPWDCGMDSSDEVANLSKTGADYGGALCCRDGI